MSKKILIIGNSAKEYALVKVLAEKNEVYVAPGSPTISELATCVDIREDAVSDILEFVLENDIDLTISLSIKSIKTDIVDVFNRNSLQIFAPSREASRIVFDKSFMKKSLYKLRIPTPKFGIFEKLNMAVDYIKNLSTPFVIKTNETSSAVILTTQKSAKNLIESAFLQKNQRVLIEDYIWGTPFSFYTITDGYKALPIGSSILYKHSLEGEGGQLTNGMGACVPNYKLSVENEHYIMDNVIYPVLESMEMNGNPYLGILGVNGVLTEDGKVQILGFSTFMQDSDADAVLSILDVNILELMQACIIGSFSDEIDVIPQKELFATSLVLNCKNKENIENIISGLDNLEDETLKSFYYNVHKNRYLEYEAETGEVLVLTSLARTVTKSVEKLYKEAECINFKGISYRKDICKPLRMDV